MKTANAVEQEPTSTQTNRFQELAKRAAEAKKKLEEARKNSNKLVLKSYRIK